MRFEYPEPGDEPGPDWWKPLVDLAAFVAPPLESQRDGTYRRHATIYEGLDGVGLWELPWLRPDLAVYRRGLSWDERWQIWDLVLDSQDV